MRWRVRDRRTHLRRSGTAAWAAVTKSRPVGGLTTDSYCLRPWRLDVQDQGVGRVAFFQGLCPRFAVHRLLPGSAHGLRSMRVCALIPSCEAAAVLD